MAEAIPANPCQVSVKYSERNYVNKNKIGMPGGVPALNNDGEIDISNIPSVIMREGDSLSLLSSSDIPAGYVPVSDGNGGIVWEVRSSNDNMVIDSFVMSGITYSNDYLESAYTADCFSYSTELTMCEVFTEYIESMIVLS